MSMMMSSKLLSKTDIDGRLVMETCILNHLPNFPSGQNHQTLFLEDEEGQIRRFTLTIRNGRHKKPLLSAGWRPFVHEKNLQQGYKVQFFKIPDEVSGESRYKIKLKKPVVVFNTVLGYVPLS
ncbi:hypothetical protein Pint_19710 [Pistacia integerrima]|uniref:Uncharacterized protein n=1 Tax=Pistacia integerrima TaxID=434235 RepID=A0ACC0XCA0_9ROSI|nr:hypothetical protein Pint_19710 [Pistacia integerrima]